MADIEDGEILDSPENELKRDSVAMVGKTEASMGSERIASYRSNITTEYSSSDNSDEGEEDTPLWRHKQQKYFRKQKGSSVAVCSSPTLPEVRPDTMNVQAHQQRKKSNNIWGSILTEQDLTQSMIQSAAVDRPDDATSYNERNVESYDFTKKFGDTRPELDESELVKPDDKLDPFESVLRTSSGSSRSRSVVNYEDTLDKSKERNDFDRNMSRQNRKRKADCSSDRQRRSGVHDRLGAKKRTTTQLGDIHVSIDMENSELAKKIAEFLHEAKIELVERVVEHLGKEVAIRLLGATRDVEETGGMYIFDGSRRRTPGGVFLTLMKQQPEFNNQVRKLIFVEDVEEQNKAKKEKRKKAKAFKKKIQQARQRNVKEADGKSMLRSNSNSRSRSPPKKELEKEEAMDDGELKRERSDRNSSQKRNNPRPSRRYKSSESSSDDDNDKQRSNQSKPYNFEDELAAAKKRVLEKSKPQINAEGEAMDHANNVGPSQDKENFSEMTDLDTAEANVVDIDLGIDTVD